MRSTRFRTIARPLTLPFLGLALMLAGCAASSGLVNMWRDPEVPAASLRKVYVVSLRQDAARRRIMEDAFASALNERGVAATPSYRDFPAALPDTVQVAEAVQSGGFDAVLVISGLDTRTVQNYVPGYV